MTRFWQWLIATCLALSLIACGGSGDDAPPPPPSAKTTLLVYLLASDLLDGRGAERDLHNMLRARNHPDVNVVLQIGGGKTAGQFAGVDMQQTRRYHLVPTPGGNTGWTLEPLPADQQPPQVAMNRPDTLRDFLQWGARAFPAQQYALSLWDHGGGPIHGYGNDHALGGGTALSLPEIGTALTQSGLHFELIGFDSCLMASLEVASYLAPVANYLVGSEEVTYGWDWTAVINHLAENPDTRGDALGRAIVESYDDFDDTPAMEYTAYSVTDLRQVAALEAVLGEVADEVRGAIETQGLPAWWAASVARREAQDFQSNLFQTEMDLVDVQSWVHELAKAGLLPTALVARFDAAHQAAVIHVDGSEDDASGLMMFFPRYATLNAALLARYDALNFSPAYRALIRSYAAFAASAEVPKLAIGDTRAEAGAAVADIGLLAEDAVKRALPLPERPFDQGFAVLLKDGVALSMQPAAAQGAQLRLAQPSRWPAVDGTLVTLLPTDEDDEGDEDELRQIPVIDAGGSPGMLLAMREPDGRQLIRWHISYSAVAGTLAAMVEIDPGDRFWPLQMNLLTGKLQRAATALQAPAGDWPVGSVSVTEAGHTLHLAASDLVGQLQVSPVGLALPLTP